MVVKYPKSAFIISAILTVAIFLTGVMLGWSLDSYKENDVLNDLKFNELDLQSYFLEQNLLNRYGGDACKVLQSRIGHLRYTMYKIGSKLPTEKEKTLGSGMDLDYLKRKYTLSEIQLFLLIEEMRNKCNSNYIPILFFYTKDNEESRRQGYVLDLIDKKYDNVVVLSFDKDYIDEPLINTLTSHYQINSTSTIVIAEKIIKRGFVSVGELRSIIEELK